MLTYISLKDRPRDFLAATGLTHEEFARLLPTFAVAYAALYPLDRTLEGKMRQRQDRKAHYWIHLKWRMGLVLRD